MNANVEVSAKTKSWLEDTASETICALLLDKGLIEKMPARHRGDKAITIGAVCDRFINEFSAGKAPRTVTTYNQAKSVAVEYFADKPIEVIGPTEAREFWSWMITDRGLAENTAKVRLRNLRTAFELAIESEQATKNPFKAKGLSTSQTAARKHYVPTEVVEKIVEHCPTKEWKVFFQLIRAVPMRIPSEFKELTWADIKLGENTILVHSPKTRHIGKHARLVPIFEHLRQPLNDLYHATADGEQYVFPKLRTLSNVAKLANDILAKAEIESWPCFFNSIRASAETDLMDNYGLRLACQWAGNSPATAMKNYALVRNTDFDDAGNQSSSQGPKSAAYSDALTPFDAYSDAERASTDEKQTPQNTRKAAPTRTEKHGGCGFIGQAGLEPATKGL